LSAQADSGRPAEGRSPPSNIVEIGALLREMRLDRFACTMEIKIVAGSSTLFQVAIVVEDADASALEDNLNVSVGLGAQFRRRAQSGRVETPAAGGVMEFLGTSNTQEDLASARPRARMGRAVFIMVLFNWAWNAIRIQ